MYTLKFDMNQHVYYILWNREVSGPVRIRGCDIETTIAGPPVVNYKIAKVPKGPEVHYEWRRSSSNTGFVKDCNIFATKEEAEEELRKRLDKVPPNVV